jgi:hypothetical protein
MDEADQLLFPLRQDYAVYDSPHQVEPFLKGHPFKLARHHDDVDVVLVPIGNVDRI